MIQYNDFFSANDKLTDMLTLKPNPDSTLNVMLADTITLTSTMQFDRKFMLSNSLRIAYFDNVDDCLWQIQSTVNHNASHWNWL